MGREPGRYAYTPVPSITLPAFTRMLILLCPRCFLYREPLLFPCGVAAVERAHLVTLFAQEGCAALPTRLAAMVHVAVGHDEPIARDAGKPASELPVGNIQRPLYMAGSEFGGTAHINDQRRL